MSTQTSAPPVHTEDPYHDMRCDLAAVFQWTAYLGMNEAVANHFSLAVEDQGTRFLINPNQRHFSRIRASDLLLLDANSPDAHSTDAALDPTAWGLHAAIHRQCSHARCLLHLHPVNATVLASLKDSELPPIDQNTCMFYQRHLVDDNFGGLAFEDEGERCAQLLRNPDVKIMVMGNHGVLAIGDSVADAFNHMYYFERAAETYIKALQTNQPLRRVTHEVAERTAHQLASYPDQAERHLDEIKLVLERNGSDFMY